MKINNKKLNKFTKLGFISCIFVFSFFIFTNKAGAFNTTEFFPGDALLIYGDGTELSSASYCRVTQTGSPCASNNAISSHASQSYGTVSPFWTTTRNSPVDRTEILSANINGNGILEMLRYNGTTWVVDWTENLVGSTALDTRAFDLRYENSGEAVVAWAKSNTPTDELEYRVWDGTQWGASASYNIVRSSVNEVTWIAMIAHPASGSDQNDLGLCYVTAATNTSTGCVIWDGDSNAWGNEPAALLTSDGEESVAGNAVPYGNTKSVDLFYEQGSGNLVAVSGVELAANADAAETQLVFAEFASPSWGSTTNYGPTSTNKDGASSIECSPVPYITPTGNNRAICFMTHGSSGDAWGTIWNGSTFGNDDNNQDTAAIAQATARIGIDTMWLINGTSSVAFAVYGDSIAAALPGDAWNGSAWATVTGPVTVGVQNNFRIEASPYLKNEGIILLMDASGDLDVFRASISSGTTVTIGTVMTNVTQDMTTVNGRPADIVFYRAPNPDQKHFVWRNDNSATEASATSISAMDIPASGSEALPIGTTSRLRFQISNEGAATSSADTWQLEFTRKKSGQSCATPSDGWSWLEMHTPDGTGSAAFDIEATNNITNGDPSTNISGGSALTDEDPTFVAGQLIDAWSSASAITLTGDNFTEIEYAFKPSSVANTTATYCFRLTDGGSDTLTTYSVYPTASVQAALSTTFTQHNYQWRYNADSVDPGSQIAAENTSAQIISTQPVRLRINLDINTATLDPNTQAFKLGYSTAVGGPYTDVGATTSFQEWRFYENSAISHGTTVTTTYLLTDSNVRGSYMASNSSPTNPFSAGTSDYIEYDFSLDPSRAQSGTTYYFRMFKSNGDPLAGQDQNPQVSIVSPFIPGGTGGGGSSEGSGGGTGQGGGGGGTGGGGSSEGSGGGTGQGGGGGGTGGGGSSPVIFDWIWLLGNLGRWLIER